MNRTPWGFAEFFIISQTALPAILYLPGTQAIRLPLRVAPFAISLLAYGWYIVQSSEQVSPPKAQSWVIAIIGLLGVMLFHPETPSLLGGIAHVGVYCAVLAPLFWAPYFVRTPEHLARLLWVLLICSGCNAVVGVLQVYDPQRWMPVEFSRVITASSMAVGASTFTSATGQQMLRPPGLFDTPGAVAGPAMAAAILGLVFATSGIAAWKRVFSFGLAAAGLAAVYLSQVRVSLVLTLFSMLVFTYTAFRQHRLARATQFGVLSASIVLGSLALAIALGGPAIMDRVMTLLGADPLTTYHNTRGYFLELTFRELLFQSPLGLGLGRWGMTAGYFSTFSTLVQPLWAEIQLTGWMIDGGIIMIVLYTGALVVTGISEWRLATKHPNARLRTCAAVVLSVNVGTAALIFTYTPFVAQIGIQYWFLAGALHGVASAYGAEGA